MKLSDYHFLSNNNFKNFDNSTLSATDFDVDPRSAFLPPDEPVLRLDGKYLLWELALDSALNLPIQLDDKSFHCQQWRKGIESVSTSSFS